MDSPENRNWPAQDQGHSFELHICQDCHKDNVIPVEWEAYDSERWHITLHCPDCVTWRSGLFTNAQAARHDDVTAERTYEIGQEIMRLEFEAQCEEMGQWVTAFSCALEADAIQPFDLTHGELSA